MGTEIMGATRNEIERAKGAIEQHLLNKGWSKNGDALQGTCIICNGGSKGRKDTAMFWIGSGAYYCHRKRTETSSGCDASNTILATDLCKRIGLSYSDAPPAQSNPAR